MKKKESAKHAKTRTYRYSSASVVNKTAVGICLCGNCSVFSVRYLFILIENSMIIHCVCGLDMRWNKSYFSIK
jgi:hypothetical protein